MTTYDDKAKKLAAQFATATGVAHDAVLFRIVAELSPLVSYRIAALSQGFDEYQLGQVKHVLDEVLGVLYHEFLGAREDDILARGAFFKELDAHLALLFESDRLH